MSEALGKVLPLGAAALLILLAGWIYWPGQTGPSLLDDQTNVLVIDNLSEKPELFWDYVYGNRSGPLGRPVSMASFVAEKLFLGDSVATSKKVNIVLHLFNGALVICIFWLLFRHIAVPGYQWLALILGATWLLSPLYVSTVLYIVQRMAMLCTTFMLIACIAYIRWRELLLSGRFSSLLLCMVGLSIVLGVFAKENAIVVIPVLLLIEALWFQFAGPGGGKIVWLQRATLGLIALGVLGVLVVLIADYENLAAAFRRRHFTLEERFLTQSRILWEYLGQLYLPDVARMGVYHDDVVVSTSLVDPRTTAYSVAGWLVVIAIFFSLLFWQWGRYLALGIAWYLVGHSIESTVFSLELYFEHRNYFPGVGPLLFVGVVFALLVKRWPQVTSPLLVYLFAYTIWLASLTGSQVQIWSSHPLLILHQLNGHPDSFRANADMAVQMANLGEFEAAQTYSAKAYSVTTRERSGDHDIRDLALACIGDQPVNPQQISELGTDNPERPFASVDTLHTLVRMLQDNTCPGFDRVGFADRMAELFLDDASPATASSKIYLSLAILENSLQRWQQASDYTDVFLQRSPVNKQALLMKLHFTRALGKVAEADGVIATLLEMQERGELTVGEQQTLSLYLEK